MIKESTRQFELLPDRETPANGPARAQFRDERCLGFEVDSREWLRFLADEWWFPSDDSGCLLLGVGAIPQTEVDNGRLKVVVWIDPVKLPDCAVPVFREGKWTEKSVRTLVETDTEVVWPGVIPLSAVCGFSVDSPSHQARLGAMAKGFDNSDLGTYDLKIAPTPRFVPASGRPSVQPRYIPPARWNAMRGAAAMATWAVPAIDPWLDLFCESLSLEQKSRGAARGLGAPWLANPPWANSDCDPGSAPLWTAIREVLIPLNFREEWRPVDLVEDIASRAITYGAEEEATSKYRDETRALLFDELAIHDRSVGADPLWLALQLVMLRPEPENFLAWVELLPSMSPATWWTGAMLSGLITGFKDLDKQYRGTPLAREILAVRTWNIATQDGGHSYAWPDAFAKAPTWQLVNDKIQFVEDGLVWGERKTSRRGEWFRADLSNKENNAQALQLALRMVPSAVRRCIRFKDEVLDTVGDGKLKVDKTGKLLTAVGEVGLVMPDTATIEEALDIDAFRDWLAVGVANERLPVAPRPELEPREEERPQAPSGTAKQRVAHIDHELPGLVLVPEFVSPDEETELLREVDKGPWLLDLKRRVQHYGWKYDYKARRIEQSAYLGRLPEWAAKLATRLVNEGLISEIPDQVIVNEYVGSQGISKHIDCPDCFQGPVVTISLNETWGMIFRHEQDGNKVERMLERRSAAVLSGEVREKWAHEIPKRKKEGRLERGRRVSLTFRKVKLVTEAPQINARSKRRGSKQP